MAGQNGSTSANTGIERLLEGPDGALVSFKKVKELVRALMRALPLPGTLLKMEEGPQGRTFHVTLEATPRHPWMIYKEGDGYAVFPAEVQYTLMPTLGGEPLDAWPPPSVTYLGGELKLYVEFDLDAESSEGIGGVWQLVSGSQEISNVEITTTGGVSTPVECDPDTGVVTAGHYIVHIGTVQDGRVTAQTLRFSIAFNLCSGGGINPIPYG